MKIAIIGAPDSVEKIYGILSSEYTSIKFIKYPKIKVKELLEITQNIENEVDGIYLTGIAVYSFLSKNLELTKPIVFTKRGQIGMLKSFWQLKNDNIKLENLKIGIDVVEEKDILEVLEEFEINIKNFYLQKYDFSIPEEEYLQNFLTKFKNKEINCIFTSFGHIYYYLKEKNIPVYRIQATKFEIKEEFKNLLNTIKYKKIEKSLVCVQIIKLAKYSKQNRVQGNLLQNKIEFEKDLLDYSKEMEGNIQITSDNEYLILSNKGLVYNNENLKTINHIVSKKYKKTFLIGIGIGEGDTIHQSEKNARNALKLSISEGKNNIFFYDGFEIKGPLMNEKEINYINSVDKNIINLSKKIGISSLYIEKIRSIMKKLEKDTFTSEDLANFLNITERSVNRILKKIIENGYAEEIKFENSTGAGRPRRIIKINF
ncbi:hypothetical protein DW261_09280 [Fusobacterium varium]|uniref:hypothetical protein n=1 Tax=Fusobacterium varium TaxID=856 RepID=UPI000E4FFB46|nr:hypothetical protein [Fusobacterium varium]RHG34956.1 hypothetical protein DW261_09280 [Fusobacterium varium]